jgi:hypothetical protein
MFEIERMPIEQFDALYDAGIALKQLDSAIRADNKDNKDISDARDDFIKSISAYGGIINTLNRNKADPSGFTDQQSFVKAIEESDERKRNKHRILISSINILVKHCQKQGIGLEWTKYIDHDLYEKVKFYNGTSERVIDFHSDYGLCKKIGEWAYNCAQYIKEFGLPEAA